VAYTTDIGALTHWGKPYLLGPGSIELAHTEGERITLAEMQLAVGLYEKLAETVLCQSRLTGDGERSRG
jgi:acetylornithine deacetylase